MATKKKPARPVPRKSRPRVTPDEWQDVPMSGDPGGDVHLMRAVSGRTALVPVAIQQLAGDRLESFVDLEQAALVLDEAKQALSAAVAECRDQGLSWGVIGWAVGTSSQAARQRWGVDAGEGRG